MKIRITEDCKIEQSIGIITQVYKVSHISQSISDKTDNSNHLKSPIQLRVIINTILALNKVIKDQN